MRRKEQDGKESNDIIDKASFTYDSLSENEKTLA